MSNSLGTTYCVEYAKSGRSNCKKCKTAIDKNDVRIGVQVQRELYDDLNGKTFAMTSWYHVACVPCPRAYMKQWKAEHHSHDDNEEDDTERMVRDFCTEVLFADTGKSSKNSQTGIVEDDIVEILLRNWGTSSKKRKSRDKAPTPTSSSRDAGGGSDGDSSGKKTKKKKKAGSSSSSSKRDNDDGVIIIDDSDNSVGGLMEIKNRYYRSLQNAEEGISASSQQEELLQQQARAFGVYHKHTMGDLKDILRWNKQYMTGSKDLLLLKVIDGVTLGRLGCCGLCGGRLKMFLDNNSGANAVKVRCDGVWHEDQNYRQPCAFVTTIANAARLHPWYDRPPSQAQMEEMEQLIEEARSGGARVVTSGKNMDADVHALAELAKAQFPIWDISNGRKVVSAAKQLVTLFQQYPGKTLDLPESTPAAHKAVGTILMAHPNKFDREDLQTVIASLVQAFGFQQTKHLHAAQKQAAVASSVKHPANAALVSAFTELSGYYFKEGNGNAGSATSKAAMALAGLNYEVTETNALGLGKGKTKVANIGAKSAERIREFMISGSMEKLEEKRASHGT